MPSLSGLRPILLALPLLTAAPACLAEDEEYSPGRDYVVETEDGGAFTSEIADSDRDSLYFVDGSAISRTEVAAVRRPGEWAEARTLHPGPETVDRKASAKYAGGCPWWELLGALLSGFFR